MNDKPGDQVSINIFEQINLICKEFRRAWKDGKRPRIEGWLKRVNEGNRSTLFSNLLQAEIKNREKVGERPGSKEYLERFPQFAGLVRSAFDESTMGSMDQLALGTPGESAGELPTQTFEILAANRLGDYELVRELGRGGFGVVYEARHLQRNNRVALKTLPTGADGQEINADRLHKFRREFRSLSEINHPNLVGMQTLEVDGSQWFFTMDLIEGEDFLSYVRPEDQLDEERLRSAFKQLAGGIVFLHERGIVHRDLKPSNVLVDEDGRVAILDFGLVAQLQTQADLTASRSGMFAGTPRYAAPEQMFGQRSEASDWYALGTMLYEALTGGPPFTGKPMEVLQRKQNEDPPGLVEQEHAEFAEDLAALTDGLLKRDSRKRLVTSEIIEALQLDLETRTHGSSAGTHGSSASVDEEQLEWNEKDEKVVLVGREEQLSQLDAAKQDLLDKREPIFLWITGKSGEGKSSLVEKFLRPIRLGDEIIVLSGRCYDRESVPFKAIDSVMDPLVAFLRGQDQEIVRHLLPEDIVMLAQLFPILGRVDAISRMASRQVVQLDSKQIRYRAFGAMRELLRNISQTTPIVMFIDDLQWGDFDSADVMFQMLTSPESPAMLFVGSYRQDEAEKSPYLLQWQKLRAGSDAKLFRPNVEVGPLSEKQCVSLVISRIGIDGESTAEKAADLHRSSGGNPYLLDQLIASFDPDTGSFHPRPLADVIRERLTRLPNEALPLLQVIAVYGQSVPIEEASMAAGFESPPYSALTHMRTEQLIRMIGSEELKIVDTWHDKIRETVLDGLDDQLRRNLHLAYGQIIERLEGVDGQRLLRSMEQGEKDVRLPARVFDLAFHFSNAGDPRTLIYSILAAEQAVAQYALPLAIRHYETAERLMENASDAVKYRVLYGFGTVSQLAGQYRRANEKLGRAVVVAPDTLAAIKAKSQQADIIYKTGSLRESITACANLLQQLDCPIPKTRLGKYISAKKYRLRRWMHLAIKHSLDDNDHAREKIALQIDVLRQLTYPCIFRNRDKALWATSIADDMAAMLGNKRARMVTAAMRTCVAGFFRSDTDQIEHYASISRTYAEELNDRYGQALCSQMYGIALIATGRCEAGARETESASRQFEQLGDIWRKSITLRQCLWAKGYIGEFASIQRIASNQFSIAVEYGQNRLAMGFLCSWLQSTDKTFPLPKMLEIFAPVGDDLFYSALLKAEIAGWYLKNGDIRRAIENARSGIEDALELTAFSTPISRVFSIYAHALREQAAVIDSGSQLHARRQALRAAKQAVRYTRKSKIDLPYALRELALNYVVAGKYRKAYRQILASREVAQQLNARYEFAQSLLVLGQIGEKLGKPDAKLQIEEAESQLASFNKQLRDATIESFGSADSKPD